MYSELSDINDIVKSLNGKNILLFDVGEYDLKDIIKVFDFIGVFYKKITKISDALDESFDLLIVSPTTHNITLSMREMLKYEINMDKVLLINPNGYLDYELLDILDCVVIESPMNFIEFIRDIYKVVQKNDNFNE